jgi:hypothetical protein
MLISAWRLLAWSVFSVVCAHASAQSLRDLIQVNSQSTFATGLAPTAREQYDALPEAPRTRSAIARAHDLSARFPEPGHQGGLSPSSITSHWRLATMRGGMPLPRTRRYNHLLTLHPVNPA